MVGDALVRRKTAVLTWGQLQRVGRTGRKRDGKVVVLLAEIREEKNWDKAKEQYRDVQKAIIDGSSIELFDDAARMIPEGIQPQCIEKKLTIEPYDREVHGDLTGRRLRTKAEPSASTKKRKRATDISRNVPEGAMLGFVSAASLTVRKKSSKKKASSPRPDGLDSDDEAIEAGVFGATKQASESEEDIPAPKSATKTRAKKTPAKAAKEPKVTKARSRKASAAAAEDASESPTLSQPQLQLEPSPKRVRKAKSTTKVVSPRSRGFSTSSRSNPADTTGDVLFSASSAPTLSSSPIVLSPPRPKPFPLAGRKPAAPPSSPANPSPSNRASTSVVIKSESTPTSGVKRNLSWLLHSDSEVEILNTPPKPNGNKVARTQSPAPSSKPAPVEPFVLSSPVAPIPDPPTDSPERSFPVRRTGRTTHMAILDSSPIASPSGSQDEAELVQPATPLRRRIRRGRRPSLSPSNEAEAGAAAAAARPKGKGKAKRSMLDNHHFLETEAQFSGSEDEDGDFDPEGVENEYDREFVRDSPLTQAPAGYNQRQYYMQSLMTQVPGVQGPNFASGPFRYGDYVGRGGAVAGRGLGNQRRPGVSSSPVREGAASQYVHDSFVVDDEEDIEYEESSDRE